MTRPKTKPDRTDRRLGPTQNRDRDRTDPPPPVRDSCPDNIELTVLRWECIDQQVRSAGYTCTYTPAGCKCDTQTFISVKAGRVGTLQESRLVAKNPSFCQSLCQRAEHYKDIQTDRGGIMTIALYPDTLIALLKTQLQSGEVELGPGR